MALSGGETETANTRAGLFATTHWSVVLAARQRDCPQAAEALEQLCRTYWYPLYAYVRCQGCSREDGLDLTQAFFADLLGRQALGTVAPCKGRFRSFLLASLKHFLANEWHKTHARKRGGDRLLISWDALEPQDREALGPSDMLTPEKAFHRRWAWGLLERAMHRLRGECVAAGKGDLFAQLRDYLTGDDAGRSYRDIAAKLEMTEGAVKVSVHRLRRRFGELLRAQVAQTVDDPKEVSDEIRELFAALE